MADFVRLTADHPKLDGGRRVLRAADYQKTVTAAELISEAEAKAAAIQAAAQAEYDALKARGYDDGMAEAKAEVAEQIVTIVTRSVDFMANAERDIARTVLVCLRKVLGEFTEEELVLRQARAALHVVRSEPRVTLRVRPEVEENLRERLGEILRGQGEVSFLEIVADEGMERGGCRLETEVGVVDASLDLQLKALEKAILSRVEKAGPAG
ncbi:HrpE/YscL family type III secretion apparatus protein [Pelagibius sp.]|uniref:HrpE/YscL family type III secretion apparatus protein n=1 Tax=Pelagibius sp. TaxID=1931238 RepID=UPI002622C412|nr:HrpE/YscL family type III secretion apparatus protein [Pelagibius sp.]